MELVFIGVVWLVLCFAVSRWAENKGLDHGLYFLLALLLSPLVGLILVAIAPPNVQKQGLCKCPDCAEWIQPEARKCRFCGHEFPAPSVPLVTTPNKMPQSPQNSSHAAAWGFAIVAAVILLLVAISSVPGMLNERIRASENNAVANLRLLNTVCIQYSSTYGAFPESLAVLGPPPNNEPASRKAADLINRILASGRRNGYTIEYKVTAVNRGKPVAFAIVAMPQDADSGMKAFYMDSTGVIRQTTDGTRPNAYSGLIY